MDLNSETILDYYTYKSKKILCQIKVAPSKSPKLKTTCRCLTSEQWKKFDEGMEKLLALVDEWNDEKCLKFSISPYIEVMVQKSKLSARDFYKCLGAIRYNSTYAGADEQTEESDLVLACVLDFQLENPIGLMPDSQEYEPQIKISPDGKLNSSFSYEPYTPSKKKYRASTDECKIPEIDFLGYNEDTYSPKHLYETPELAERIPKYTPAAIRETRNSKENSKSNHDDCANEAIVDGEKNKTEFEYIPKSQEFDIIDVPVYVPTPIKQRSKTIDDRSAFLCNPNKEEFKVTKTRLASIDARTNQYNTKYKSRSKTIDEIPSDVSLNIENLKIKSVTDKNRKSPSKRSDFSDTDKKERLKKRNYLNENYAVIQEEGMQGKCDQLSRSFSSEYETFNKAPIAKLKNSSKTQIKAKDKFEVKNKLSENVKLLQTSDSGTEKSPQMLIREEGRPKEHISDSVKSLRRSERSPNKPKRLIDEQTILVQKCRPKNPKPLLKQKELFGTDDDDDDNIYFENNNAVNINNKNKIKSSVFETPEGKKSSRSSTSSSSSSVKKKRKRNKSTECNQEKHDMSKWLSKKKPSLTSLDKETKKSSKGTTKCSSSSSSKSLPLTTMNKMKTQKTDFDKDNRAKSPSPPKFEMPSKEELESIKNKTKLMQKENAKLRAELDKMRTSPPKEVEFLSLQNIPVDDILNTFPTYKSELDEIYKNNRKRDYIKGHDGINHCFVIRLLKPEIQMKMLEKLTEIYSKSTTQATLFANALLPEWVIRVYMEKFQFTRQQAISQIKAQEEFQLHMEELRDNSQIFD